MISRILAPNPGLYTGPGTNTYIIVSEGEALVLDPGPVIDEHAVEIVRALEGLQSVAVVATHTHPDHAPLANPLAARLGVPVYGYEKGPHFVPDITVADGETITVGSIELLAVHTPGHTPDHLCFRIDGVLFTGDHIMGGSSVIIEDAAQYLESLYLVRDLGVARLEPGHGDAMDDAAAVINDYIDHRLERERQILAAVAGGASSVGEIVDVVYAAVPAGLRDAATHQVMVQISKLFEDGAVSFGGRRLGDHTTIRLR
ncbi:MAG: MBL fold metallo-hydrolase [Actinomycetia bacterium]|nr:MBL fold metallo-hydrolase [Actinomycetes bacterium]